mgnify:CR=1 FL=1
MLLMSDLTKTRVISQLKRKPVPNRRSKKCKRKVFLLVIPNLRSLWLRIKNSMNSGKSMAITTTASSIIWESSSSRSWNRRRGTRSRTKRSKSSHFVDRSMTTSTSSNLFSRTSYAGTRTRLHWRRLRLSMWESCCRSMIGLMRSWRIWSILLWMWTRIIRIRGVFMW